MDPAIAATRESVQARLGRPVPGSIWRQLVRDDHVSDYIVGVTGLQTLVDLAARRMPPKAETGTPKMRDDLDLAAGARAEADTLIARSVGLAQHAARRADVLECRRLMGGLIGRDQVHAWVQRQAEADGPPTTIAHVALDDGQELRLVGGRYQVTPSLGPKTTIVGHGDPGRELQYLIQGDSAVMRRRTRDGGVLSQLLSLGNALAADYGWHPAQATTFVLTGITPIAASVWIEEPLATSSLMPEVRIRAVFVARPDDIRKAFLEARDRLSPGQHRGLSPKRARLATFIVGRPPGEPRSVSMELWNAESPPRWRYTDRRRFGHDARDALRRIRLFPWKDPADQR